jgi:hypothetical protein
MGFIERINLKYKNHLRKIEHKARENDKEVTINKILSSLDNNDFQHDEQVFILKSVLKRFKSRKKELSRRHYQESRTINKALKEL